ncbi:MAG TPA: YwqG family protein [Herpetosiphonaceae bacterium]
MDVAHFIRLIDEHGLSDHQVAILDTVRPAIFLRLGSAEQGQLGQSRIGGVPDLPTSLAWPENPRQGGYLAFLLQINLAELPVFSGNPLPRRGMLYLFADESEDYSDQLIVYLGNEQLQPRRLPDDAELIIDWYDDLVPHQLTFLLAPDVPRWATSDYEDLSTLLDDDELALNDLGRALSDGSIGKLLGHVSGIGHDPRGDAYVVREVNPDWIYNYEQRGTLDMSQARSWHNLLEIDSSHAVDLMFGDAGYLQVLIHGEDLIRQNFSRVYVNLESS